MRPTAAYGIAFATNISVLEIYDICPVMLMVSNATPTSYKLINEMNLDLAICLT